MTIPTQEMHGSPTESTDVFGFKATRTFLVDWSLRHNFMEAKIGGTGELYPYKPETKAVALRASSKPFPGEVDEDPNDTQLAAYKLAVVTVEYGTRTSRDPQVLGGGTGGGTLISQSLEPNAEMQRLHHKDFRWKGPPGNPLEENEAPAKLIVTFDYVLTLYRRFAVPPAARTLIGHVNSQGIAALLLNMGFEAGTLLFNPPFVEQHIGPSGIEEMTVTYRFTYRFPGWNLFWNMRKKNVANPNTLGEWDEILEAKEPNDPYLNYPKGDFTVLTT